MNTVIPYLEGSNATGSLPIFFWVIISIFAVPALILAIVEILQNKDLSSKVSSLGIIAAYLGVIGAVVWFSFSIVDGHAESKEVDTVTLEKIEENLDVDLQFNDIFSPMIGCKDNLVDQTIDSVIAVRDSNRYLVSFTATKNDDETCTYEVKPYEAEHPLFESVDTK